MYEQITAFIANPAFIETVRQWLLALTSIVTAASALTALTPTRKDDRVRSFILAILDFLALNIGNARRNKNND